MYRLRATAITQGDDFDPTTNNSTESISNMLEPQRPVKTFQEKNASSRKQARATIPWVSERAIRIRILHLTWLPTKMESDLVHEDVRR